jgi:hypothetical protein
MDSSQLAKSTQVNSKKPTILQQIAHGLPFVHQLLNTRRSPAAILLFSGADDFTSSARQAPSALLTAPVW